MRLKGLFVMFCNQCGTKLKEGVRFCINCGTRIDDGPQSQALQAVTSATNPPSGASASMDDAHSGAAALGKSQPTTQRMSPALLWGGIVFLITAALVITFLIYHSSPSRSSVPDAEIEKALQAKFAADPNLSKCTLEVHSQAGVVTLIGPVDSDSDKSVATRIAEQQEGVKQVNVYGLVIRTSGVPIQGEAAGASATSVSPGDIHSVDFRNFIYPSNCRATFGEDFDAEIRTSNGQWKKDDSYFFVGDVTYGDVIGDSHEEAAVETDCGPGPANLNYRELYIFSPSSETPRLLARFTAEDLGGRIGNVRTGSGSLVVNVLDTGDGSEACPEWVVTTRFRWNGNRFVGDQVGRSKNPCYLVNTNPSSARSAQAVWLGFANDLRTQDRDVELRKNCGDFGRVYVPSEVGNGFTDLCSHVSRTCEKVCDWEGRSLPCEAGTPRAMRDGTRIALCR